MHPLANARPIRQRLLQLEAAIVDEVVANVRRTRAATQVPLRSCRGANRGRRDVVLRNVRAPRQVLDDVAIAVARLKRHRRVDAARIAAQLGFGEAGGLDELRPVDAPDGAKARDAVRHHELREGEMLRGPLHRFLDAHHFVGDPLLEPHQRREVGAPAADLLEETSEEGRRERWRVMHQVVEHAAELVAARVLRGEQARDPAVGLLRVGRIGDGAQGHVPHVLEVAHAQHRRHGPELAHRERRDALILANDQLEQRGIESSVRVRDELDGELVHARIPGERARPRELRQLVVVAARQRGAHFAHLLDDDVEVVEQPLARRTDGDAARGSATEHGVRATQHALRGGEAREERSLSARPPAAGCIDNLLQAGEMPAVPREAIRTEQLAKNHFTRGVRRPYFIEAWRLTPPGNW